MPRQHHRLTARQVQTFGPGRHADGGGLYLDKDAAGRARWIFFATVNGKRREMGLGGAGPGGVSLAQARQLAVEARELVRQGIDPVEHRRRQAEAEAALAAKTTPTFGAVADQLIASMEPSWRNEKHKAQWRMTLDVYAAPLRARPVDEIDTEAVLQVLKPVWLTKAETASRLRGRIEAVLAAATARGFRTGPNPALWRGHLDRLLPKRARLTRGHHGAMPFEDVPEFVRRLRETDAMAARALEFLIYTAARSGEVLGATWAEIDLDKALWIVPARRMKAGREHRVPLSRAALAVLEGVAGLRREPGDPVFPGRGRTGALSGMAMEMLLRRLGVKDGNVTVHGFRSSFRDWAGEVSPYPRDLAEQALAHVVGDATERAYRRGDAVEKRRDMMEAWATWCEPRTPGSNVVPLAKAPAA